MVKNILAASYYLGLLALVASIVLRIAAAAGTALPVAPSHGILLAAACFLCALASRAVAESASK